MRDGEICSDPFGLWRGDSEPIILENRASLWDTMVKVAKPSLPTELPREVLAQLDPKLAELYSQLPSVLASRISVLVRQAQPQRIDPNRVFKFAFLYAAAERIAQSDALTKEHARRSKLELAGEIHELQTGYRDDAEAKQRYRSGRKARQHIKASLEAVVGKWRVFKQVVERHRSELPVHLQLRYSDAILRDISKALQNMGIATILDEEDLASEKDREREPSAIAQTYILWCLKLPRYRGKWNDMHQLAFAWRMSPAGSVESFRTVVVRICKGATCSHSFGAWESVLSEK